ncbi:MAG: ribonuclease R [Alphaproteobacteria bacterium]|nr:ribonuclease R [Alphaproteobacteria bacterium]
MADLSKEKVFDFIRSSPMPVTKRQVARAFGIKGGENRVALKQILKALEKDGSITKQPGGVYAAPDSLPTVAVIEVHEIDLDGDVFAKPLEWDEELKGNAPKIEIIQDNKHYKNLVVGSRALARLSKLSDTIYEARIIRLIDAGSRYEGGRVLGIVQFRKNGAILQPTDKKAKYDFDISNGDLEGASDGDLVAAEVLPSRGLKRKKVRVINVLGKQGDPKAISLISLHEAGLNDSFPESVVKATEGMKVPDLKSREDLRDIPLVTIDGADARDFDDAVFAEKIDDGTYHLIVAIADVAHYVTHGSALDDEAQRRGNSTYFPDRVVPMLPEALSNDLCSLRPKENRASLAVHMWIDQDGKLIRYKFVRALIKSAARLIYEQVQAAHDGQTDDTTGPLMETVIQPLYEAYHILDKARQKRGALELDLPERQILIDEKGRMTGVKMRERLDAHKLIEEFMVLANVAAASALQKKDQIVPCVYRVHDRPSYDKLESAREFLESFGLSIPKGQTISPDQINYILKQASKSPYSHLISQMILRTQSQAVYQTENIGHFGLALQKYAHFTSPIRRYADLLVHRALISAYDLGKGGLSETEIARIDEIAQHISETERVSMTAERNAVDRFTASYLSSHIGAIFAGTINGVTRFGLFVTLKESGADGLIPMKSLDDDFYAHDEKAHALIGQRRGHVYRMGAPIQIVIKEADGTTGSCIFGLAPGQKGADIPGMIKPAKRQERRSRKPERKGHKKPGHRKPRKKR